MARKHAQRRESRNSLRNWGLLVMAAGVATASAQADTLHVPDPCPTIQSAIDAAEKGDEIIVAPGTYFEAINFVGKAITVRSSDGPDVTTIDGAGDTHVVQCGNGEGPDTVLDGFTITGGNADGYEFPGNVGGGMLNIASSPTVTNCSFIENTARLGGSGMHNDGSNPMVTNCQFIRNRSAGSDPMGRGGRGGGMNNVNGSNSTVINCSFFGNSAQAGRGNGGGGMSNNHSSPTVTNCTFVENHSRIGGGMSNANCNPTVTNCSFIGNHSDWGGGGMRNYESVPTVTNCIFWGDSPDEIEEGATVTYSNIQGGFAGEGNIDADPLFVDPDNGDFRLSAGSLCIDAADNTAVPAGITLDLDGNPRFVDDPDTPDTGNGTAPVVDMGAYEFQDGCDPCDMNCDGAIDAFDIDPFLDLLFSGGMPCNSCTGDTNGDGHIDAFDIEPFLNCLFP